MGWIKERIEAEHRKYSKYTNSLDWTEMSELKIRRQMREMIELWFKEEGNEKDGEELINYLELNKSSYKVDYMKSDKGEK